MDDQTLKVQGCIDCLELRDSNIWVLCGWAYDPSRPADALEIEVTEGETVLGSGRTGSFREDLKQAGIGDGRCGLAIPLKVLPSGARKPRAAGGLRLWRRNNPEPPPLEELRVSLRIAECGTVIVPPTPVRLSSIAGFIDKISGMVVTGWARDLQRREQAIEVEMLVDGTVLDRVTADLPRHDLEQRYGIDRGGFEWVIPSRLADGETHVFNARVAGSLAPLPGDASEFCVSAKDWLVARGLSEIPAALGQHRRYLSHIDEYYRVSRQVIEAISADLAIYCGHAGHEFAPLLARCFRAAYAGGIDPIIADPVSAASADGRAAYILHTDLAGFEARFMSGSADQFLRDRAAVGDATILIVESPDSAGGLGKLNLTRARRWCDATIERARAAGLETCLKNSLIDFFFGHPGFVLGFAPRFRTLEIR